MCVVGTYEWQTLTDEYLAEYTDGCQRNARRDVPQGSSVPEFGQDPVNVVFFFCGHRDDPTQEHTTRYERILRVAGFLITQFL